MSLILAIESDRRQIAQLTHIVRQRVGAELVLADTTERAIESIGNRVPDLILVPPLLSPQDDAALAAALRVIATAAHVQMLTIPTLAAAKPRPQSRGVLSAFRSRRPVNTTLDGCDPAVFADQIASYLERAAEERAAALGSDDEAEAIPADPLPARAQAFDGLPATLESADAREIPTEPWTAAAAADTRGDAAAPLDNVLPLEREEMFAEIRTAASPQPPLLVLDEFVATLERNDPPIVQAVHAEASTAANDTDNENTSVVEIDIDLTTELEEAMPETAIAGDPPGAVPALDEAALLALLERNALSVLQAHAEQRMTATKREENRSNPVDVLPTALEAALPAEEPAKRPQPEASIEIERVAAEARKEPIAPRAVVARAEWPELIKSLRQDIERWQTELGPPARAVQPKRPPPQAQATQPARATQPVQPSTRRPKRSTFEDAWGLFDPEQCGFSALLDKLDEITGPPDDRHARRQA
jgi:hypothetical protein